jgi:hypothetical protein
MAMNNTSNLGGRRCHKAKSKQQKAHKQKDLRCSGDPRKFTDRNGGDRRKERALQQTTEKSNSWRHQLAADD